jgi:hypothetical protein
MEVSARVLLSSFSFFLILFPALFLLYVLNLEFEFKSCGEFVLKFVCF